MTFSARLLAIAVLALPAFALPSSTSASGSAEAFRSACLKAGGDSALCTCKAEAAVKLLDQHMFELVVLSMRDPDAFTAMSAKGGLSRADNAAWTNYIRESNKACNLSY